MIRKLFGYILVAVAIVAGYTYHVRTSQSLTAQSPDEAAREQAASAGQSSQPGRLLTKLPNGLTVLVLEDKRFPLVAERLYVRAGSAYETKGEAGISHLLEHMVFNSTVKRPKGGVAAAIEGAGGDTNAATSFDYTQYMADLPSAHWKLGLDVFQDMIFGAKFDAQELEQEKKVVISELERGQDDPGQRLFQMAQAQAWAGKPYARPIIGYRETVNAITSENLRTYIARFYQPQSMLLVVVGDVNAQEVLDEARRVFGSLANTGDVTPPDLPDMPANTGGPTVKAVSGAWNKCYLRLDFAVPGLHSAKDVPLEILSSILGGGKTSRFYRKFVYETQLADSVDVSAITLERGGMFSVDATLDKEKLPAFWSALLTELATLKAGEFTSEELERAKLNNEDSLYRSKETLRGLANKLAYYQFFGMGVDGEDNVIYDIRNTSSAQLQELLDTYLTPGNASLSLLMPAASENKAQPQGQAPEKAIDQTQAQKTAGAMLAELQRVWPARGAGAAKPVAGAQAGAPEVVNLGAGRTVVLLPDPTMPYASLTLTYRGGDALLGAAQQGLSELASKALPRSTARRGAVAFQDFLADRASSLTASTGRDTFTLSARYPSRFATEVTGLLAEAVLEPAFAQEEVDRAKKIQLAQIAETQDKPTSLAFRHLFPLLYPGSHYGYFRAGQPEAVGAFKAAEVRSFWEKQRTMPWVMAVCGVFDREEILKLAGRLAAGQPGQAPALPAPSLGERHEMTLPLPGRNQTHLFWVFPVPGRQSPDTPALEALNTALAGQGGLLFQDLRDKEGLGYSVSSFLWQAPHAGFLAFYIGTTPEQQAKAMEGFRRVAAELAAKGLGEDLVARAKNSLEGDYYQGRQSLSSRSQEAALDLAMGYPLNFERELLAKVRELSGGQITQAAKKYLDPGKAYLLKIEP